MAIETAANIEFGGAFKLSSVFTTPEITSKNQDDYLIADLFNYNLIVLVSSVEVDLKGLESSTISGWHKITLLNGNASDIKIKLKKNKNSSAPANRFFMKDDVELKFGEFRDVMYNPTQNRWNVAAKH